MNKVFKIGIAIDVWKLSIFERHLKAAGYTWENSGGLSEGVLLLRVNTTNPEAAAIVIKAANDEAAMTGAHP